MRKFPKLYATENDEDPIVKVHFVNPNGRGDWFVTEGQLESNGDWTFFGFVRSPIIPEYDEFGYFTLLELQNAGIVKDTEWESKPLSQAKDEALAIEALEAILDDLYGERNFFMHQLCVGAKDSVSIGGVHDPDTHIRGTHEGKILWIEKVTLFKLFDLVEQLVH